MTKETKKERVQPGGHAPRYDLGQSVQLVTEIYERAGGNASLDEFSVITGNTRKSSSFVAKLQAIKNYNLVTQEGEVVKLTEIGEQIVAPQEPAERNAGLKAAFLQIEGFGPVYEKFVGKILPQDEFLKNAFTQQGIIPRDLSSDWVRQFIASATYAGLLIDRGDGKMQVRGTASEKVSDNNVAVAGESETATHSKDNLEVTESRRPSVVSIEKTPYQFLIEIFTSAEMTPDEQKAVWTLMQFLKRQELGQPMPVAIEGAE